MITRQQQFENIETDSAYLGVEAKMLATAIIKEGFGEAKTAKGAANAINRGFNRYHQDVADLLNRPIPGYSDDMVFTANANTASVYKPGERDETNSWIVIDESNGIYEWGIKVGAVIKNNHGMYVEPYYSFSLAVYKG
jgi:hypothetical protein